MEGNYRRKPIILIPGLIASKLEAKTDSVKKSKILLCRKWKTLWLKTSYPLTINQILKLLRLRWNLAYRHPTNFYSNIRVRPVNFGGVNGIKYINKWSKNVTYVFYYLIKFLEKKLKYKPLKNLYGAPYDFRLVPCYHYLNDYYEKLDKLIMKAYKRRNYKVVIISHSMGSCLIANYLSLKPFYWREHYIDSWISISAPFGGSMESLKMLLYGDYSSNFNFLINNLLLKKVVRKYPSLFYMLPCGEIFGWNKPLLITESCTYFVSDQEKLLKKFNITNSNIIMASIPKLWCPKFLNIKILFVYSNGIPTLDYITTKNDKIDEDYKKIMGDGDGSVNLVSLQACKFYKKLDPRKVKIKVIHKTEHQEILKSSQLFDIIIKFLKHKSK